MQQQSSDMYVELAAAATASSSASSAPRPSTSSSAKVANDEHKVDRDSSVSIGSKKHQKQQQRHNSRKFYGNTREPVAEAEAEAAEEDKSHEERATVKTAGRSAVRRLMAELNILATETSTVSAQELKKQKKDINAFMDGLISQLKLNVDVLRLKMNSYRACDVQVQTTLLCGTAAISFITGMEVFYKSYNSGAASAATDLVNSSSSSVISDGNAATSSSSSGGLSPGASLAFSVVVFIIAASMGLLSAVTKFVGRKDKSDAMAQVVFKASAVIADIPQAQQQLKLIQTREELEMRLEAFLGREYKSWLDAMRSIESIMSLQSLTDHLPDFYMLSLRNIRDAHLYESHAARYSNRGQSPLHYYHQQQQQQQQQRNNFADATLPLPSLSPSSLLGPLPQNNLATYVEKTRKHDAAANESKHAADQEEEEVHVNIETDQIHSASV